MKDKRNSQVSMLYGADGPTCVFVLGKLEKPPLKIRIRDTIYESKRKKVEKTLKIRQKDITLVTELSL